jgi:predicted protein tyrosine phosphatase
VAEERLHVLFVCSRNLLRSPTAENIFFDFPGVEVRSAGTARDAEVQVSRDDVDWADLIFVMERTHQKRLKTMFNHFQARVVCLDIPDDFEFMDPELIKILQDSVTPYLEHSRSHHANE